MADVAAFFDLDGTLIPRPSLERRFLRILRARKALRLRNCFAWLREALRLLPHGINLVLYGNKAWLRGIGVSQADALKIPPFYSEAVEKVTWHSERGHAITILSGTLEPLAMKAAELLEEQLAARGIVVKINVFATRLEEAAGSWTGRIVGEAMFGEAKARAMRRFAAARGIELARCFAYGDSVHDRCMLATAGIAVAVNPSSDLGRIASRNGWEILHWSDAEAEKRRSSRLPVDDEPQIADQSENGRKVSGIIGDAARIPAARSGYRP
jgi:HAD superfamily phosphoserine phosphatase-like hydrolase